MIILFLNKCSFNSWTVDQFKDETKGTRKIVFRDAITRAPTITEIASSLIVPLNGNRTSIPKKAGDFMLNLSHTCQRGAWGFAMLMFF